MPTTHRGLDALGVVGHVSLRLEVLARQLHGGKQGTVLVELIQEQLLASIVLAWCADHPFVLLLIRMRCDAIGLSFVQRWFLCTWGQKGHFYTTFLHARRVNPARCCQRVHKPC